MGRIEQRKKRKKRRLKRYMYILFALFLVVGGVASYFVFQTLQAASSSYDDLGREQSDLRDEAVNISDEPFSVLIMGVEDYETEGASGRTDTLMLVTFDPDDQSAKMLSIPRDTRVDFAGMERTDKINHAYAFGGKEMAIDTVEKFLEIPVDYYVSVDFDAFIRIVDVLDGVTVNVPFDFEQKTMAPDSYYVQFYEGEQHVNGEEALAFVRMRKEDPRGDLGRVERQQEFLNALADEAMSLQSLTRVDRIAEVVGEEITTNVRIRDGFGMLMNLNNFDRDNLESVDFDTYHQMIGGVSYQTPDQNSLAEARMKLKKHLQLVEPTPEEDEDTEGEGEDEQH
ncbi:LCP family protein [Alkalibacillus haloalkaliphilus]|uniref:LCP family protein n=1 Tax=Alkalibacillus haloalkaliphilus TaxID=94136 RepID=UPI00293577D8|nr:LCP family protein [Alkalibacillus haloalkaliphilus]MDV2582151.1 LCP family protein [Alkalibacillus haloalkaliphilus]